jgi:hypothetical protein
VTVNGAELEAGDGVGVETEGPIQVKGASERAEVLLFDMAM